jgi:hypothetical protein
VVTVDHKKEDGPTSCFIAGTMVATSTGQIAIEKISEGAKILTEATSSRIGYVSSSLDLDFEVEKLIWP